MSLSFDPEAPARLAALLNDTGLSEIEMAEGDRKLRLARTIAPVNTPSWRRPPRPPSRSAGRRRRAEADPAKHPGPVKSPMVGVAYLSPEPGAPPMSPSARQSSAGRPSSSSRR